MSSSKFWNCRSYEYNNVLKLHCVWVTFCFWSKLTCACFNRNSWSSFFSSLLLAFFITGLLCLHKSPLSCLLITPKCCVDFVKRVICWQLSYLRASFAYWLLIPRCCFWEGTRQILSLNVEIQVGKMIMLAAVLAFNYLGKWFHQSWKYICKNETTELCQQHRHSCLVACDHCLVL